MQQAENLSSSSMMEWKHGDSLDLLSCPDHHHGKQLFLNKGEFICEEDLLSKSSLAYVPSSLTFFVVLMVVVLSIGWTRWHTRQRLVKAGLPTVFWLPKFSTYNVSAAAASSSATLVSKDQKLASSNITNILPRMKRLGGSYGMYGTVYGLSTGVIHVAHPVPAQAILIQHQQQQQQQEKSIDKSAKANILRRHLQSGASKAPAYNHFKNFFGEGVFTADGLDWRRKRAAVIHALMARGHLENLQEQLETTWQQLQDRFDPECQQDSTKLPGSSSSIDIVPLLQRATMSLIYRYITHSEPETEVTKADHAKNNQRLLSDYLQSIVRIRMIILAQSRSIWFLLPRWCYRWFSSMYLAEEETLQPVRSMARRACEAAKPDSPLGLLVRQAPALYNRGAGRETATIDKNLLDEATTLLFAGQDTSAATLSWTLHLLSVYPALQTRLAEEVKEVLKNVVVLDKKVLSKMPLLDAVIKEAMRLYPVAPFVVRRLVSPVTIPPETASSPATTVLPANSLACIWIYSLHRNPAVWTRPDDFWPDRWLTEGANGPPHAPGAYMPFAAGPRNCVGQPLAHVILRTLLARLVHRYEFRDARLAGAADPDDLRIDMQAGFTVLPKGGVHLEIYKRISVQS